MMRNTAFRVKLCPVWSRVQDKKEGKMYGILLESVQFFVIQDVGEDVWNEVLQHAGMKNMVFSTHTTYSDDLMVRLATSCCHVTKREDFNHWMTFFGTCFVEFCSLYGYDNLLQVSGRTYRDFLHGIDNIHEIIRFSYPRLQSPSFLVLFEDKDGCVLLYQSKRRGFKHYVKGQLSQIAKKFYKVTLNITILEEDFTDNICSVKFRLDFDNSVYLSISSPPKLSGTQSFSSISGDIFLKVFPFCVVFNNQLVIKNVGHSMAAFLKGDNLIGCHLREKFHIRRPLIPCIWNRILRFQRVIFELEYLHEDDLSDLEDQEDTPLNKMDQSQSDNQKCLLRGEMKYIKDWDMVAFLCTPLLNNLKDLQAAGLYINDLNMFDMSRDMVMAGWQHASQLERSIEQQQDKSELISDNMGKIEEWKKKSDSLLYSMIPESIAERLKSGMNPIDTCQLFDLVTIMFVYMVGFSDICTSSSPMEIVKCINNLFVMFDQVVDQYDVFKVETLGDAVYMVAGGVPDRDPKHAINVAMVALKLQEKAKTVIYQIGNNGLNTRIGMHSGSVVGGVVGRRMPQYCLFGDTVNTASRMQTYSLPGKIHVSEPCNECLQGSNFVTVNRGKINIKGKGEMQTYWLYGEEGEDVNQTVLNESEVEQTVAKRSSCDNALDLYGMHASTSYSQIELQLASRRASIPPSPPLQTSRSQSELEMGYRRYSNPHTGSQQTELQTGYRRYSNPQSSPEQTNQRHSNPQASSQHTGYRRYSTPPMYSLQTAHQSLSILHELKQAESPTHSDDRLDIDEPSDDLGLGLTSTHKYDSRSTGLERGTTSGHRDNAISFFLHHKDSSEDPCDPIGDTEQTGAVGGSNFTVSDGAESHSNVFGKNQESFADLQAMLQDELGQSNSDDVFSMFCPFLSSNIKPEKDTQVSDMVDKTNNKPQVIYQDIANTECSRSEGCSDGSSYLHDNNQTVEADKNKTMNADSTEPNHSLCPFMTKLNHVDTVIGDQQIQSNNNNKCEKGEEKSEEVEKEEILQNHSLSAGRLNDDEIKTAETYKLLELSASSDQEDRQISQNGSHEVSDCEVDISVRDIEVSQEVDISVCDTEVSHGPSVDGRLIEKIRKLCCMSPCNGQCIDQDNVETVNSRKLSTSMTDDGETQNNNDNAIERAETNETLHRQTDNNDQITHTNLADCNTTNGSFCKKEYRNSLTEYNGLLEDLDTISAIPNGHLDWSVQN